MSTPRHRTWRRGIAVVLAGGLVAWAGGGTSGAGAAPAQGETPPVEPPPAEPPPEIEPAPPGFADELVGIYASASTVVDHVEQAGAPGDAVDPEPPSAFAAAVAALTPEELGMIYAATREVEDWPGLSATYQALADQTAPAAAAGAAAIPPPPDPPPPSVPIEPTETLSCPPEPPGGNFGHDAIYAADVATTAITAVSESIPNPILFNVTSFKNPAKDVVEVALEISAVVGHSLTWLKDRYFYCEGENQYVQTFNTEAVNLENYALLEVTESTVRTLNAGVITVSEQLEAVQAASDELLATDIQVALLAPVGSPPNVAYELPAAHGGHLDSTPIGVRSIVTESLAAARRARLPVNASAATYLAQADAALAQQRYVPAFQLYQRAYQGLVGA